MAHDVSNQVNRFPPERAFPFPVSRMWPLHRNQGPRSPAPAGRGSDQRQCFLGNTGVGVASRTTPSRSVVTHDHYCAPGQELLPNCSALQECAVQVARFGTRNCRRRILFPRVPKERADAESHRSNREPDVLEHRPKWKQRGSVVIANTGGFRLRTNDVALPNRTVPLTPGNPPSRSTRSASSLVPYLMDFKE
jgi:hypothetical protein